MNDTAVLSGPGAMIANVPSLIGFVPTDSLVATYVKGGKVLLTQRADLAPALESPEEFFGPVYPHGADDVIVMLWSDEPVTPSEEFLSLIHAHWNVVDVLWVRGDRWGSLLCKDEACCPPEGHPIDSSLRLSELDEPAPSREAAVSEGVPMGTERMKPLKPHGIEGWRDKSIQRIIDGYEGRPLHPARIGRSLHDIRVRDTALWHATGLSLDDLKVAYRLACGVAEAMHPADAAPACTCAGVVAWLMGDGARANAHLERALSADPSYSLALLVDEAIRRGTNPGEWREAMSALTYEMVRKPQKEGK